MAPPGFCETGFGDSSYSCSRRVAIGSGSGSGPQDCVKQGFRLQVLLRRHRRPLLWPAIGFLIGATYQPFPVKPLVWALLFVAVVACLIWVLGISRNPCRALPSGPARCFGFGCNMGMLAGSGQGVGMIPEVGPSADSAPRFGFILDRRPLVVLMLLVAGFMAGSFRESLWARRISDAEYLVLEQARTGSPIVLVRLVDNPRETHSGTRFTGELWCFVGHNLKHDSEYNSKHKGFPSYNARYKGLKVSVYLYDGGAGLASGDFVVVRGKFSIPARAMNPGEFDYRRYLMGKQVFLELKGAAVRLDEVTGEAPYQATEQAPYQATGQATGEATSGYPQPASGYAQPTTGHRPGNSGLRFIFQRLAHHLEAKIDAIFPGNLTQGETGVIKALLLGDRGDLSPQDSEHFRAAGLYRFIAIAGFHVQLAAGVVERVVRRLTKHRNISMFAGLLAAFLLAGLSGWAVGPLRAFLCVLLKHLAFWCRRKYDTLTGFAVCSFIIGWRVPYPLADVSFQLSFAGMLAGWVTWEYTQALTRKYELGLVRHYLVQSTLVGMLLLPLLAVHFQDVSIAGFLFGGLWGLLSVAVSLATLPVVCIPLAAGRWLSWCPFLVIRGLRQVGAFAARLPLVSLAFPSPKLPELVAYYCLVFMLLDGGQDFRQATATGFSKDLTAGSLYEDTRAGWRAETRVSPESPPKLMPRRFENPTLKHRICSIIPDKRVPRKFIMLGLCCVLCVSVGLRYYCVWPQVVFLSVGQADTAVIRTKGTVIVVDTGTETSARRVLVPYLKHEGIRKIDLCIISHLHADHAGGLGEVCRNFKVNTVMTCPGSKQAVYQILKQDALGLASGTRTATDLDELVILEAGAGDVYAIGGAVLTVIHPPGVGNNTQAWRSDGVQADALMPAAQEAFSEFGNEHSLVIGVSFGRLPAYIEFWGDVPGNVVMGLLRGGGTTSPASHLGNLAGQWSEGQASGQASNEVDKLTGEQAGKQAGMEPKPPPGVVSIIKVPHHGSPDSLVYGFYQRVWGGVAVISVGPNSYGHPSPDVIREAEQSGLTVFRTDKDGAVTVKIYPGRVRVSRFVK